MESNTIVTKSIFDVIEERSENPEDFNWITSKSLSEFSEEEKLYEGYLININNKTNKTCKRKYILTVFALIKFKAFHS